MKYIMAAAARPRGRVRRAGPPGAARAALAALFVFALTLESTGAAAQPASEVAVARPRLLPADPIRAERVPLGEVDDYKPCIAQTPSGELLLTAFHQHKRGGKVREQTLLFRSRDGGKNWSKAEKLGLLGREPYLTVLKDGTLFITGHLLANDVANEWGYTCGFLHRSADGGKTWESFRVGSEGIKPKASNHTTRNVLELGDGTLLLGVDYDGGDGPHLVWRSKDGGRTWDKTGECRPKDFKSRYGFFGGETWLWQARSGKVWALVRVDSKELPIEGRPIAAKNDQADHVILFSSVDGGKTFDRVRDIGDYGEMYMSLLRLRDGRLLLTFTVRDLHPPLGVRAVVGTETGDGFDLDLTRDRIMLDTRTPVGKDQGGGFGPTVQWKDGTLVTSYSYRGADDRTRLEVVRWRLPGLRAGARRPAHPVLIRNDHNPMLRVVVEAPREGVRLRSLRFSLDGCDDVGDLASLALFSTGSGDAFSPGKPVGKPLPPARDVSFACDLALNRGRNVFWLSGTVKASADLSRRVAAACTSVETTAGKADVEDLSPGVRQRIGIALRKHNDDGVHTYRIPALAATPKGTLLCVYDMRRRKGRDLQEDIDIGLSRSTDGGVRWEPQRVIMDMGRYGGKPEEENGCSDPGILVDHRTGEVFVFAVWMHGKPGKHQWTGDGSEAGYEIGKAAQMLVVRSTDDGKTWGEPENLTRSLKKEAWRLFAPSPQSGINLADGTLLMPAQGRDEKGKEFATVMTSRDHGKTWAVGAPAYSGGNECQAVQLADGSVMLNMRNANERFRAVYVTRDLGKTWTPHETNRKTLVEPRCNGSLIRFDYTEKGAKKHVLLFANPRSREARIRQTIQVSFDDGKTWPEKYHLLLDEGRGAGYPSLARVDDRHVGIVYEGSRAHLVFEKVPLAELLDPAKRAKDPRK